MSRRISILVAAGILGGSLALAGCSTANNEAGTPSQSEDAQGGHGGHDGMEHPADGGPVPEGMKEATDPEYPVGTEVTLTADHMEGMNGARATIVGAYDTYTYAIDYTPVDGGDPVTDHKWVVQEELDGAGDARLDDGTEATVTADHMEGMDGATATIASSTDETVYVVDYEADGMKMTNHKWVVDSEIQPAS
ncbi:YdhK family protein [Kytococcus schroeteri]|uniref:YdhK family protein n=1 Tax=Kytococcus schroeteri TaxID=138300 RepID=UPI0035EAC695